MVDVIYQVAPRYTAGSPAQVDAKTAQRVKEQELSAYLDALSGGQGPDEQAKAQKLGVDGIVETVVNYPDGSQAITDEMTGKHRPTRVREEQTPEAQALAADLRAVQGLLNRRGAAWLAKWAHLARGFEPGQDPMFLDHVLNFPHGNEPRD
jgi:hypothetical protein